MISGGKLELKPTTTQEICDHALTTPHTHTRPAPLPGLCDYYNHSSSIWLSVLTEPG